MKKILVVDDDCSQCSIINSILSSEGFSVSEAESVEQAIGKIKEIAFDVVLTDLKMHGRSGLEIVTFISEMHEAPEVIVMTAYGSTETAVRAMRSGAYDYLCKPLEREELLITVQRASEKRQLRIEGILIRAEKARDAFDQLIIASESMNHVLEIIKKVAPTESTVLIRGESGTGKERVARLIHNLSNRCVFPLQSINCSALPETLLESELFGYEKGAFTGAYTKRKGIIEAASGGTLFLDEVGDMPLSLQAKLLRVIQEKEVRPLGCNSTVKVDIRIITATHRDLPKMVREGSFREDFFYRLDIIPIFIPPLRERIKEIPVLVQEFLRRKGGKKQVSENVLLKLKGYSWPGNVRELESVIERMVILSSKNCIDVSDLPLEIQTPGFREEDNTKQQTDFQLPPQGIHFEELERSLLLQALKRSNGVMADAAKLLGMTYRTFQYRATKFGLINM
jgi:DNA-binding NtrC family response regulator